MKKSQQRNSRRQSARQKATAAPPTTETVTFEERVRKGMRLMAKCLPTAAQVAEGWKKHSELQLGSFECDCAKAYNTEGLPQDVKECLRKRRAALADKAYQEYQQAEKDGTLIESTVEEYLAWLSIATGIDLAELLEGENQKYVAKVKALRDHALQNSINVTGMDWNEFLAALGRNNPPEEGASK